MFEFEIKYTVLKNKDIEKYLDEKQCEELKKICNVIEKGRKKDKRGQFGALVIEKDWPEFGPTLRKLELRVNLDEAKEVFDRNDARLAALGR